MDSVPWDDRFSVGVPELDAEHRRLVDTLNRLHEATVSGRGPGTLEPLLAILVQQAGTHFMSEERYLRETQFAEYDEHKAKHAELMGQVYELKRRLETDHTTFTPETVQFLKDWVLRHILIADLKYAVKPARAMA